MNQLPHALIPSKTFLFGEYAILADAPAVILATPPFFELISCNKSGWHEDSAAAKILANSEPKYTLGQSDFKGLGRSGAECIASWLHFAKQPNINELIDLFKQNINYSASGADIVCMWLGYCTDFTENSSKPWPFEGLDIGIWATKTQIATHTHLQTKPDVPAELIACAKNCYTAWKTEDKNKIIEGINEYQAALVEANLQLDSSSNLVTKILQVPEVLASKACGALGADIILTISQTDSRQSIIDSVSSIGLTKIFVGNYAVPGIAQQWSHLQQSLEYEEKNAKRN